MRKAEAEFARSQYERWRDSPKGVVSDQEREQKRADYDSAAAQHNAALGPGCLIKAQVDRFTALAVQAGNRAL